jgi:hypothetical protein
MENKESFSKGERDLQLTERNNFVNTDGSFKIQKKG